VVATIFPQFSFQVDDGAVMLFQNPSSKQKGVPSIHRL
jgi:hypothetical protein